jgi:hypothetical protein
MPSNNATGRELAVSGGLQSGGAKVARQIDSEKPDEKLNVCVGPTDRTLSRTI